MEKECNQCAYWDKAQRHRYKCYTTKCPAYIRDNKDNSDMSIYEIWDMGMEGRSKTIFLGVFKGISKKHAKDRASKILNNPEIFTTGFYEAFPTSQKKIDEIIIDLQKQINKYYIQ